MNELKSGSMIKPAQTGNDKEWLSGRGSDTTYGTDDEIISGELDAAPKGFI